MIINCMQFIVNIQREYEWVCAMTEQRLTFQRNLFFFHLFFTFCAPSSTNRLLSVRDGHTATLYGV